MEPVTLPADLPAMLTPWAPSKADPWDYRKVAHLYRRAGFGATLDQLERGLAGHMPGTVARLLEFRGQPNRVDDLLALVRTELVEFDDNLTTPQSFWLYRMIATDHPFEEKLALYWHNHFATANYKVNSPGLMYQHYEMLRTHALGSFDDLLLQVARDPAMLIWLDNQTSRRASPNENFARELLELFTMGPGPYQEADVKAAARAFTGWQLGGDGRFYFNDKEHDSGDKTFLGQTGPLTGEAVLRQVAAHPATARFLANKLLRFFIMEEPPPEAIAGLAAVYEANDHRLDALYQVLFQSRLFYSPAAYRALVKSPIELVAGTILLLDANSNRSISAPALVRMGQELLNPPNVKGWEGGAAWINSVTLLERMNFLNEIMLRSPVKVAGRDHLLLQRLKNRNLKAPDEVVAYLVRGIIQDDLSDGQRHHLEGYYSEQVKQASPTGESVDYKLRRLAYMIMTLPAYQLS